MNETAGSVRLCAWRKGADISQELAGKRFDVSQPAYRCWELGIYRPDGDARVLIKRGTNGAVEPIDFMRPPAPEDHDLTADVSHLRAAAAQPPPPEAA